MRHALLSLALILPTVAHAQDGPRPVEQVAPQAYPPVPAPVPPVDDSCCTAPAPQGYGQYPAYGRPNLDLVPPEDKLVHLQNGRWLRLREASSKARSHLGVGISFLIAGPILQAAALATAVGTQNALATSCLRDACSDAIPIMMVAGAGVALTAIAIPLLVSGTRLKQELQKYQPSLAIAPMGSSGTAVAAGIRF